ncbi:WapI family immunity protein [Dinoroseobacter sp. S76]|uniref:WapI family immunity protein n=1 Tax=Dinoroseobacter sp. S76 TaxID=3415124 RepID=UPI003C7E7659
MTVEFSVFAYEFPDLKGCEYDDNWLQVRMEYFTDRGKVVRSYPALLTWELVRIRDLIVGGLKCKKLDFMEPEIEFKIQADVLILETRYGLRLDETADVNVFESRLSEEWIAESASEIDSMCAKFPIRGKLSFKV